MKKKNKNKGFWKWLVTKWYFWVIVVLHFYLSPKESGVIISFLVLVSVWAFIFWLIYLFKKRGIHGKEKDKEEDQNA